MADGAQDAAALTRPAADNVLQMWPVSKLAKSTQADGHSITMRKDRLAAVLPKSKHTKRSGDDETEKCSPGCSASLV